MWKHGSATCLVVAFLIGCSALTIGVECIYMTGEELLELEGVKLGMLRGMLEITASQAAHVRHGWTPCDVCFQGKTEEEICALLNSGTIGFSLAVNGQVLEADWIAYYYGTPLRSVNTDDTWCAMWVYLFPAGYFDPGVYILTGRWWANTTDPEYSHCFCDLEPFDEARDLTLSVIND
jgi:hypothetical protein